MLHLRLVVPSSRHHAVMVLLGDDPTVCNLVVLENRAVRPDGTVVLFDAPVEAANRLIGDLKALEIDRLGSISLLRIDTSLSAHADWAEAMAPGDPGDAVIWDEVEARLGLESRLTPSFLAVMVIAVLLGAVAVLTDSLVLVVGAMVVGPEFGPLAAATLALHRRTTRVARRAATTVGVGFAAGIAAAAVLTLVLRAADRIPAVYGNGDPLFTGFISHPDLFSVIVAVLAGAAGMLALAQGKSGALVGVLISVTTIPAASDIAVATALGRFDEAGGATAQLAVNLVCMVVVGLLTLRVLDRVSALSGIGGPGAADPSS